MTPIDFKDQWVLVTGASAGLGREFAKQLAKDGANLVVVARSEQRLAELADELGTQVRVVAADLSEPAGVKQMLHTVDNLGVPIEHVINNAGVGGAGHFSRQGADRITAMTALNCDALVHITHHFLPRFLERKSGSTAPQRPS
jgi:uncharacterized protein